MLRQHLALVRELKGQSGLQQPSVVTGFGPDGIVIGVDVELDRLLAEVERLAKAAANRDSPFAAARDPVGRDVRRRADGPPVIKMVGNDRPARPPSDQMLLTTPPNTHGLSSSFRKAADGPVPHLLTPSAELVAVGK